MEPAPCRLAHTPVPEPPGKWAAERSISSRRDRTCCGEHRRGGGYARYLEGKTVAPERGDYYLTPNGEPAQAPGRWLTAEKRVPTRKTERAATGGVNLRPSQPWTR
jgi:hypothetical protein